MSRPRKRKQPGKGPGGYRLPKSPGRRPLTVRGPQDMIGWPGTLPEDRMRVMAEALETGRDPQGEQILLDLEMLLKAQDCMRFSAEPVPATRVAIPNALDREAESFLNLHDLTEAAWMQDTVDTIGGVMTKLANGGRSEERIVFKLLRHTEWMGHNQMLPMIRGNNATILESREMPGHPGIVFVEPTVDGFSAGAISRIPDGAATELAKILRWHGVKAVRWQPQSADHGFVNFIAR